MSLIILRVEKGKKSPNIIIPFDDFEFLLIQYSSLHDCYNHCHEDDFASSRREKGFQKAFNIGMGHYIKKKEELFGVK